MSATTGVVIWVGLIDGQFYTDTNDGPLHKLSARADEIHTAMAANGWKRISGKGPVVGNYVHSNNWPLDQKPEPLKEFYA